ncbi:MAG: hypothetical protein HOM68_19720 [Gemmatimonadetes bacterium]|nr:hypothetical protein [Gemmatimonadota bacterium]MBT5589009.1 hypothetical protein [Gemmatimonadota bacterium]MBT7454019.1 hypothetical protein [Gemmatimonadota bacterium]
MLLTELKEVLEAADTQTSLIDETHLALLMPTAEYRNSEGKQILAVVIEVIADGSVVRLSCPAAFTVDSTEDATLLRVMSEQANIPFVGFEYDPSDGEIRPRIEIPVNSARSVGGDTLQMLLTALSFAADRLHSDVLGN